MRTQTKHRIRSSPWAALPIVLAGTFMVVLDFFIVNVALPSMQSDLHASSGAIEWVVAGYGLTSAIFLITAGRLGDRFGRRRMFMIGLVLFTLASLECGIATSAGMLVVSRLLQGVAAAILMPNVLSIVGVAYSGADRVKALNIYALTLGLAAVGGQLIGGLLVNADIAGLGWRSCFLINVPIGAAALLLTRRFVAESKADGGGRIDLVGTGLVTAGLTLVVLPLVEGRQHGWPAWTWISLAVAPIVLLAFVVHQRRLSREGGAPLLDLSLFRERGYRAGLTTQLALFCGQASFFLVLALYLQQGRGLDALDAGLVFTILAAPYLAASMAGAALTARLGRGVPAIGGLLLAAGHGLLLLAIADVGTTGSVAALAPGLLLEGAGMGLTIGPLTSIVLAGLTPQGAGSASGALSTMQQVGNALGVAVIGVVFFGALDGGMAHAFEISLGVLAGVGLAVTALTRMLPRPA